MGNIDYEVEIEIVEGEGCDHHQVGDTSKYPENIGRICPWLLDSVHSMIRVLQFGGTPPWKYEGSGYEKMLDPDGITTEFIRCPDPMDSGVVAKITRTKLTGTPTLEIVSSYITGCSSIRIGLQAIGQGYDIKGRGRF